MVMGDAWCLITLLLLSSTAVIVGNDGAELQGLHSTHVTGSRGFCKLWEVAAWLSQAGAELPTALGQIHQAAAGTTWVITELFCLKLVGVGPCSFVPLWGWGAGGQSLKTGHSGRDLSYLRHRHRAGRCITSPVGKTFGHLKEASGFRKLILHIFVLSCVLFWTWDAKSFSPVLVLYFHDGWTPAWSDTVPSSIGGCCCCLHWEQIFLNVALLIPSLSSFPWAFCLLVPLAPLPVPCSSCNSFPLF